MKLHNSHIALAEVVERSRDEEWSVYSRCILFAARCVKAQTGVDHAATFPPFESEEEAAAIIAEHGSLAGLITSVLGEPIHPAFAGRGDVVLADGPHGDTAGVCLGNKCAFAGPTGLTFAPRSVIKMAWRV